MGEFVGKSVIVTGGSQNIGLAIAEAFTAQGAHVISADINPPDNSEIDFFETDISNEGDVAALMKYVRSECDPLCALINNAGIALEVPLNEMTTEQWDRVMAVNVRGVFLTTKHAFDLLRENGGAIVNISSIEGLGANPLHAAYGASKGAVSSFTHNTALEYGPHGIRCNAIAPGWINTPFNEKFLDQYPDRGKVDKEIRNLHPVGRLGLPQDIANTAVWLAGEASGFVSGQTIVVDGGRTSKLPLPSL